MVRSLLPPLPYTLVRHRRRQFNPASLVPRILIDFTALDRECQSAVGRPLPLTGLTPGRKRVSYVYKFGLVYVCKFYKKKLFLGALLRRAGLKKVKQIYRQL